MVFILFYILQTFQKGISSKSAFSKLPINPSVSENFYSNDSNPGLHRIWNFVRLYSNSKCQIDSYWFSADLHRVRLKSFFRFLIEMASNWRQSRFRIGMEYDGMKSNSKLLPRMWTPISKFSQDFIDEKS